MASRTLADFAPDLPRPAVACTIVKLTGSAPQRVGARMWVTRDAFLGTVGGGELERRVLEHARSLIGAGEPRLREFVLCKEMGQCCGGRVEIFLEPVSRRKTVHLFGGGHVGRALAEVLSGMPFETVVVDPRPEWLQGLPAGVEGRLADPRTYARERAWDADDAACVMTFSHDLDFALIAHLLTTPAGYLGLIGSEHKADVFAARLKALDPALEQAAEDRLRCPIGVPLESKNPKVIAVSIAAELLKEWGLKSHGAGLPSGGGAGAAGGGAEGVAAPRGPDYARAAG